MDVPVHGTHALDSLEKLQAEGTYNLAKGKWQTAFGFRHFRSFRHFVGSVEQNADNVANGTAERDRSGTNVINHVYQPSIGVAYGVTDQFSVAADLPFFHAHRRSPGPPTGRNPTYVTASSGFSDLTLTGRYWMANPSKSSHQNLSFGLGFKLPTGNDRAEDDFLVRVESDGTRITEIRPVDQSIQPGDGGFGFIPELQAFKAFGSVVAFVSGSYLINPRETNDFNRNGPNGAVDRSGAENHLLSIADQYAVRVGVATSVRTVGVNLGLRWEGTRGSDLIGGDRGRRRPGYTLGIDPGVSYAWHGNFVSLNVPIAIRRVRNQNFADKLASEESGHFENGDAAFADYAILIGFSRRF
jgi:hypothetical protein